MKTNRPTLYKTIFVTGLALALTNCGKKESAGDLEEKDSSKATLGANQGVQQNDSSGNGLEIISIPVEVSEQGASGLSLTSTVSDYTIELNGCASGFTTANDPTATATLLGGGGTMNVYKFDQGCEAKLVSFTLGGLVYTNNVADGATDWVTLTASSTAVFATSLGALLPVKVISQLSNPVLGTDTVSFEFNEIDIGTDETLAASVSGDGISLSVTGKAAPQFSIGSVTMTGMTVSGEGQFSFQMDCLTLLAGNDCESVGMATLDYKLIEDTYSGVLTYAQADAEMAAGTTTVTLPADAHAVGNGGFNTLSLTGPATIHSKPNMILIIGRDSATDGSYLYFNVDVTQQGNL